MKRTRLQYNKDLKKVCVYVLNKKGEAYYNDSVHLSSLNGKKRCDVSGLFNLPATHQFSGKVRKMYVELYVDMIKALKEYVEVFTISKSRVFDISFLKEFQKMIGIEMVEETEGSVVWAFK